MKASAALRAAACWSGHQLQFSCCAIIHTASDGLQACCPERQRCRAQNGCKQKPFTMTASCRQQRLQMPSMHLGVEGLTAVMESKSFLHDRCQFIAVLALQTFGLLHPGVTPGLAPVLAVLQLLGGSLHMRGQIFRRGHGALQHCSGCLGSHLSSCDIRAHVIPLPPPRPAACQPGLQACSGCSRWPAAECMPDCSHSTCVHPSRGAVSVTRSLGMHSIVCPAQGDRAMSVKQNQPCWAYLG